MKCETSLGCLSIKGAGSIRAQNRLYRRLLGFSYDFPMILA